MITKAALEEFVIAINEKFEDEKASALQITGTDIFSTPEILKFSGFDSDEPLTKILSRGIVSLRPGFYKMIGSPFYKNGLEFSTFAAKVLYFESPKDRIIEFTANVGPMTNIHAKYMPLGGTGIQDQLFHDFLAERSLDTASNFYHESKKYLFQNILLNNKIFRVSSSVSAPGYPNQKQVTWSFMS